jgi:hypothetical protein
MTQPPLKPNRRAVVGFITVVVAAGVVVWLGMRIWEPNTALILSKGSAPVGDFNNPRFSPSELVSLEELTGPLRREGFADGIGLANDLPPCTARLVSDETPTIKDPDDPRRIRSVSDGRRTIKFVDICGPSTVSIEDESGKSIGGFVVRGHAHTIGCIAPDRGFACATCFEPERDQKPDSKPESHVVVFDYRGNKELGRLKMPCTDFKSMAVSRDQQWLYIGFGDGTIRRFSLDNLFPPAKKSGWFGS